MVKKVLPGYSKSVIWDTFYEIILFAKEEIAKVKVRYSGFRCNLEGGSHHEHDG
jgi:hypothetical protein